MSFSRLILFAILIVQIIFCHGKVIPWTPVDWRTIPQAQEGDSFEVWYLLAPLLEEDFGSFGDIVHIYHGAIGLLNNRTAESYTLNYDANDFFRNSLFPTIATDANGTIDLIWDNGGAAFIYQGINITYWEGGRHLITNINGSLFNNFISNWSPNVNLTHAYYDMFGIVDLVANVVVLPSYDCFDFVWATLTFFYDNGAKLDYSTNVSRNYIMIYGGTPLDVTELYEYDSNVHQSIIDFYTFIQAKFSDLSAGQIFLAFIDLFLEGEFYLRQSTEYWSTQLELPLVGVHFYPTPLPGQP